MQFDWQIKIYEIYFRWNGQKSQTKCPNTELFWSVFSCIRTEYGDIRSKYSYLVQIRTRNNSVFGHFSRSD